MSNKLWGGRFKKKTDKDFEEFSKSIHYDYKLAKYDIMYSLIHVVALEKVGILSSGESLKLVKALGEILKDVKTDKFKPDLRSEDVHTEIQNRVEKKLGKLAYKLHSLRSRNDQIVFDEKWYCLENGLAIGKLIINLIANLFFLAQKNEGQFIVGYTHTQRAQAVSFMVYIMAFNRMFERDDERMERFCNNLFAYIGAGALAGSSISRKNYKEAIKEFFKQDIRAGKIKPLENALDNVSDRDFILEFLSILAITQMHLSRLAEDFILYASKEFDFFQLPEEFCTGSSLMPHKKNPDFLELVRGLTGRIYGNLTSVLTTMKGLPLAYNRDMQLDKEPLFSSTETVKDELKIMAKFVKKIGLKKDSISKALCDESLYATELAEFLVYQGVSFKQAHDLVGKLVQYSEDKKTKIKDIPDRILKSFHKKLDHKSILRIMNPHYAVSSKKSLPQHKMISRRLPKKKTRKNK
ncbi:MAG: argininosuccinate lyase [Candidatus Omnitrophica bacterium]|nr:argininosuccinate lyase [Candidatus Omnitrophota bacterium]